MYVPKKKLLLKITVIGMVVVMSFSTGVNALTQGVVSHQTAKLIQSKIGSVRLSSGNGFLSRISASPQKLRISQYSTITATTNSDVGPTPYYISLYDLTAHSELAVCAAGTTCSATLTQQAAGTHAYKAYVGNYPTSNRAPGFVLVSSRTTNVTWYRLIITPSRLHL